METVTLIAAFALIWKLVDFSKFVTNKDFNGAFTQLFTWVAGVGVVFLISASDFGKTWDVNGILFNDMAWGTKVIVGLLAASAGSGLYDLKKARDGSDTAVTPPLVPGTSTTTRGRVVHRDGAGGAV